MKHSILRSHALSLRLKHRLLITKCLIKSPTHGTSITKSTPSKPNRASLDQLVLVRGDWRGVTKGEVSF